MAIIERIAALQAEMTAWRRHLHAHPSMGSEDYAFMLRARPGCYVWLGNGPMEGGRVLHSPHYDFNDVILPIGASYWATLVERELCCG